MSIDPATASAIGDKAQIHYRISLKLIRMNALSERAVGDLIHAGSQNLRELLSAVHPGVGERYDFRA